MPSPKSKPASAATDSRMRRSEKIRWQEKG